MTQIILGQIMTLWQKYSIARYTLVHCLMGIINFGLAAALYGIIGLNHHLASLIGHFVHVTIGFFIDRNVSFRSPETTVHYGAPRYWIIELISYSSIVATMYTLVDVWQMNPYFVRGVVAMLIASAISYGLNRIWTFKSN